MVITISRPHLLNDSMLLKHPQPYVANPQHGPESVQHSSGHARSVIAHKSIRNTPPVECVLEMLRDGVQRTQVPAWSQRYPMVVKCSTVLLLAVRSYYYFDSVVRSDAVAPPRQEETVPREQGLNSSSLVTTARYRNTRREGVQHLGRAANYPITTTGVRASVRPAVSCKIAVKFGAITRSGPFELVDCKFIDLSSWGDCRRTTGPSY
jgi:hypothetical protein